jgi:hypothetical protein
MQRDERATDVLAGVYGAEFSSDTVAAVVTPMACEMQRMAAKEVRDACTPDCRATPPLP